MDDKTKEESIALTTTIFDALSGVPALGILSSVNRIYTNVQERIFAEKVEAFFKSSDPDPELMAKFQLTIEQTEPEFAKKLWVVIDRLDVNEKAEILGRMFKALLKEEISRVEYLQICDCVNKSYIDHIKFLFSGEWRHSSFHPSLYHYRQQLVFTGLMKEIVSTTTQLGSSPAGSYFEPSDLGRYLLDYGPPRKVQIPPYNTP